MRVLQGQSVLQGFGYFVNVWGVGHGLWFLVLVAGLVCVVIGFKALDGGDKVDLLCLCELRHLSSGLRCGHSEAVLVNHWILRGI